MWRAMTQTSHGLWPEKGRSERRGGVVHLAGAESPNKLWIFAVWLHLWTNMNMCVCVYNYNISIELCIYIYINIYIYIVPAGHHDRWCTSRKDMFFTFFTCFTLHFLHVSKAGCSDSCRPFFEHDTLLAGHLARFQHQIQSHEEQNDAGNRRRGVGLNKQQCRFTAGLIYFEACKML